jgi:hypothetical protein
MTALAMDNPQKGPGERFPLAVDFAGEKLAEMEAINDLMLLRMRIIQR